MGFLSNLFGGGKSKDTAAAPAAKPARAETKAAPAVAKVADAKPAKPEPAIIAKTTGAEQVKLRLKLAAAERTGDIETAYRAAKGLADIQTKAGRRVPARIWRAEAERIIEEM